MWGILQETARIITLVLDRSGGSNSKCPRCRGSGLLENSFTRLEKNGAHPNQPCWFCEGIGAFPIVGLTGFVLARTTPCLQALNKHKNPCVEVLEQSHFRDGKETCKFTNAKLGLNLLDLSFDYSRSPWLNCTSLGCQQSVSEECKARGVFQSHVSVPRRQLLRLPNKEPPVRSGLIQILLTSPLVLSIVSKSQPNATASPAPSLLSRLQPSAVLVMAANENLVKIPPGHELRSGCTTPHVPYTSKILYFGTSAVGGYQEELELSCPFVTKLRSQTACSVFSAKRQRRQRKARNCIRSKARKAAQERAGRFMRTLKHKDEQDLTNAYILPDATSQSFQGLDAHTGQISSSSMALRLACLTSVAVRRHSWINRLVPDGFKALMPKSGVQAIPFE